MQTSKKISNITYNTPLWLQHKLNDLKEAGYIEFWAFFDHKPEMEKDNLANKKRHIHFFIKPNKRIDTMKLSRELWQYEIGSNKPLKPTDDWHIVNSWPDWWLYGLHDPEYLRHKGLEREFHYQYSDCYCSDLETLERMVSFIDLSEVYRKEIIYQAADAGLSFKQAMARGVFGEKPQAFAALYSALLNDHYHELAEARRKIEKEN